MKQMFDFESAVRRLENAAPEELGSASCDFAAAVWNGRVLHDTILDLMIHGKDRVRECLAWAVWDARGPEAALELLLTHGSKDSSAIVRNYALKVWRDLRPKGFTQDARFLCLLKDENCRIREKAQQIFNAYNEPSAS